VLTVLISFAHDRMSFSLEGFITCILRLMATVSFEQENYKLQIQSTDHKLIPAWSGRVWCAAGDCWIANGSRDGLVYNYTQTENIQHFQLRVMSECTVRMLSGFVVRVATGLSRRNIAHAHQSHS
jgi:hypothetical protein